MKNANFNFSNIVYTEQISRLKLRIFYNPDIKADQLLYMRGVSKIIKEIHSYANAKYSIFPFKEILEMLKECQKKQKKMLYEYMNVKHVSRAFNNALSQHESSLPAEINPTKMKGLGLKKEKNLILPADCIRKIADFVQDKSFAQDMIKEREDQAKSISR